MLSRSNPTLPPPPLERGKLPVGHYARIHSPHSSSHSEPPPSLPNPTHPPYIKNYKKGYANVRTSFKLYMLVSKPYLLRKLRSDATVNRCS